eukprot:CAMPEP_0202964978 /NCGR_PEP_ID=MMETSP1396-20130829/9108_1 /ASSEMBLY_ACC=CAM_ASM_000872 /TAXON_ID= /ORGANISM="Pseudokeronopsis sp., Strain Brazil" /LENGTH=120 /DNA_ID=CAMNT_0049687541 /DNA_START=1552 /DNA_END=1914 /DNA_ORIENTATION=+
MMVPQEGGMGQAVYMRLEGFYLLLSNPKNGEVFIHKLFNLDDEARTVLELLLMGVDFLKSVVGDVKFVNHYESYEEYYWRMIVDMAKIKQKYLKTGGPRKEVFKPTRKLILNGALLGEQK